jgi:hypothetical protein
MRWWFVLGVAGIAALLGWALHRWGTGGEAAPDTKDAVVATAPGEAEGPPPAPEPGQRQDCPDPGAPVEPDAAALVQLFMAEASGLGLGGVPASDEVEAQLEADEPSPPVTRMTRVRGFVGSPDQWSTCVLSTWTGPDGPTESLDVVTVRRVEATRSAGSSAGDDEDGAEDDADSDAEDDGVTTTTRRSTSTTTTTRPRSGRTRWEVSRWLRGVPQAVPTTRAATVAFYDTPGSCGDPDRLASVPVRDGEPPARLELALEELISGTTGRAATASSQVPSDVQVLRAEVTGSRAVVELTPTGEDLTRCQGTAAYDQVRDTAAAIVAERSPEVSAAGVDVEVLVEGREVSSLR